jgi:hypothetical protein
VVITLKEQYNFVCVKHCFTKEPFCTIKARCGCGVRARTFLTGTPRRLPGKLRLLSGMEAIGKAERGPQSRKSGH